MTPISCIDLDIELEAAEAPSGEPSPIQWSELTAGHRETIVPEAVGQELPKETPRPPSISPGSEEPDVSHHTAPVWWHREHTRMEAMRCRRMPLAQRLGP